MPQKRTNFIVLGLSAAIFLAGCAKEPEATTTTPTTDTNATGGNANGTDTKTGDTKSGGGSSTVAVSFEKDVKPVMTRFCLPCHSGPAPKGELDMSKLTGTEKAVLGKMAAEIEMGKMPPPKATPVAEDAKAKFIADLKTLSS